MNLFFSKKTNSRRRRKNPARQKGTDFDRRRKNSALIPCFAAAILQVDSGKEHDERGGLEGDFFAPV